MKMIRQFFGVLVLIWGSSLLTGCAEKEQLNTLDYENLDNNDLNDVSSGEMEPTVLLEENNIKITAESLSYTEEEVFLNLKVENNQSDEVIVYFYDISVNNYVVNATSTWSDVDATMFFAANETYEEPLIFDKNELELYGIDEIADISFGILYRDADYVKTENYPYTIQMPEYEKYSYSEDYFGAVIESGMFEEMTECTISYFDTDIMYQEEGIKVQNLAVLNNTVGHNLVVFEVINESTEDIILEISNISVNDFMVIDEFVDSRDRIQYRTLHKGKHNVVIVPMDKFIFENLKIDEIGKLSFDLVVRDMEMTVKKEKELSVEIKEVKESEIIGEEVYNANGIRVWYQGCEGIEGEFSTKVYPVFVVENRTEMDITFNHASDSKINGLKVFVFFDGYPAGKKTWAMPEASILEEDALIDTNNITKVYMELEIMDMGTGNIIDEFVVDIETGE